MTEQLFEKQQMTQDQFKTEDSSYTYGWGWCPDGDDGGLWMHVKGIDYEGQRFEHWSFMRHYDVNLYDNDPPKFFKRYSGIKEVVGINRNLAWRHQKSQYRLWGG